MYSDTPNARSPMSIRSILTVIGLILTGAVFSVGFLTTVPAYLARPTMEELIQAANETCGTKVQPEERHACTLDLFNRASRRHGPVRGIDSGDKAIFFVGNSEIELTAQKIWDFTPPAQKRTRFTEATP